MKWSEMKGRLVAAIVKGIFALEKVGAEKLRMMTGDFNQLTAK
ncbi:hypothetical protein [Fluviicola chungangensis]|nr:hypothetical protein [Fluviicola chungangensis]